MTQCLHSARNNRPEMIWQVFFQCEISFVPVLNQGIPILVNQWAAAMF